MTTAWPELPLALRVPLLWSALYTAGLKREVRDNRRAVILSDVYEQLQDGPPRAQDFVVATLTGIPDDLAWRASHLSLGARGTQLLALGLTTALTGGILGFCFGRESGSAVGAAIGGVIGLVVPLIVERSITTNYEEGIEMVTHHRPSDDAAWYRIGALACVLFPLLVLAGVLLSPSTSTEDLGGGAGRAELVADNQTRWALAYFVATAALGVGVLAVVTISARLREMGHVAMGSALPIVYTLGAAFTLSGAYGAFQLGSVVAAHAGQDVLAYSDDSTLDTFTTVGGLGGVAMGLALAVLGFAVFRARLVAGTARIVAMITFILAGAMTILTMGGSPTSETYVIAAAGLIAFGLCGVSLWRLASGGGAAAQDGSGLAAASSSAG